MHVFGQQLEPMSLVVPSNAGGTFHVTPPSFGGERGVVPGLIYVQVLAPGQPATGAEVRRMLIVPEEEMAREVDALMRGAGGVDEKNVNALPPIIAGYDLTRFNTFHKDLGCTLQAHHRSELYTPAGRRAVRRVARDFARLAPPSDVPATTAMLKHILDDVLCQEAFEHEQRADEQPRSLTTRPLSLKSHESPAPSCTIDDGLDDMLFPIKPEIRLNIHQAAGSIHVSTVTVTVLKSTAWGVSPVHMALLQIVSFCYAAFFVMSMFSPTLATWALRRFQGRKGRPQQLFFEMFVILEITVQNILISTLFTKDDLDNDTKWRLFTVMHITVMVFLGLWRAETAPLKAALRLDIALQAALHVSLGLLIHFLVHGHLRYTRFADGTPFGYLKVAFWFWFVPVAVGTKARSMNRRQVRVAERLRLVKKLA